jgi:hypothetical protein
MPCATCLQKHLTLVRDISIENLWQATEQAKQFSHEKDELVSHMTGMYNTCCLCTDPSMCLDSTAMNACAEHEVGQVLMQV